MGRLEDWKNSQFPIPNSQLSTLNSQPVCCQLPTINYQLSTINYFTAQINPKRINPLAYPRLINPRERAA
ncbi:MAG: hypothetical protein HC894_17590 [Microcoleus sp. SM1_3_4]|nr:hypothetical protein [Microcoleus sp. SM1_3_4]